MFHNNLVLGRVDKGVCLFTPYPPDLISGTQEISNFPVISCLSEKWWMRFASSTLRMFFSLLLQTFYDPQKFLRIDKTCNRFILEYGSVLVDEY